MLACYRAQLILCRPWRVFQNHYWIVGLAILGQWLSFFAGLSIGRSFRHQNSHLPSGYARPLQQQLQSGCSMDSRVLIDTAIAVLLYQAGALPWTDGNQYAFRPFSPAPDTSLPTNATSLTARTVAHSASLSCSVLRPTPEYQINIISQTPPPNIVAKIRVTALDQDCPIQQDMTVTGDSNSDGAYLSATQHKTCNPTTQYSRLLLSTATSHQRRRPCSLTQAWCRRS